MTTLQDIFKSSFLENIASVSLLDMCIAMLLAFLLGLFIFLIYKSQTVPSGQNTLHKVTGRLTHSVSL